MLTFVKRSAMCDQKLVPYVRVVRDINASVEEVWGLITGFGAEKTWYPGCLKLTVTGFGIGSVRTFHYEYPDGPHKGERYTFSEEMTAVDAVNHSMSFRVRRPDYPDMIGYGTTAVEPLESGKTRFVFSAEGSPLPQEYFEILQKDLNGRFDSLIIAMAKHVE